MGASTFKVPPYSPHEQNGLSVRGSDCLQTLLSAPHKTGIRGGYGIYYPFIFYNDPTFPEPDRFYHEHQRTSYAPAGGNTNFPAFQLQRRGSDATVIPQPGSGPGPEWLTRPSRFLRGVRQECSHVTTVESHRPESVARGMDDRGRLSQQSWDPLCGSGRRLSGMWHERTQL